MSEKSTIQWTEATWNPVTGCSKVSPGCAHCYAETLSLRFGTSKLPWTPENAAENVVLHPERLDLPLKWRKPRMVFVNSMSDLFHEQVPDEFIDRIFAVMALASRHTFQILTKRPERMLGYLTAASNGAQRESHVYTDAEQLHRKSRKASDPWNVRWPGWPLPNVWLGVSVENQRWADERIPQLLDTPAAVWFVSGEPLLGPLNLTSACEGTRDFLTGSDFELLDPWPGNPPKIDWVIAGGESGGPEDRRLVERCPAIIHQACDLAAAQPSDMPRPPSCCGTGWRPKPEALAWVRAIRDQCVAAGVPFFFKQWGGPTHNSGGRVLDGRTWDEMPAREPVSA